MALEDRRKGLQRSLGALAVLVGLTALSAPDAYAQDIDTFKPSGSHYAGWGSLQLHHPEIGLKGGFYGGVGLAYADHPLVLLGGDGEETTIVRNQLSTRVSAGYNIAGPEVEDCLLEHAGVSECAVVGVPSEDRGTIVKAYIVPRPGYDSGAALAEEIQNFVKNRIAPYKYPRAVEFIEELPKTQTGKVQRFRLRQ